MLSQGYLKRKAEESESEKENVTGRGGHEPGNVTVSRSPRASRGMRPADTLILAQ